ncbi:Crp/Fnr family transcriptional regulator [Emticicia fontis]
MSEAHLQIDMIEYIKKNTRIQKLPKGTLLLTEGQISDKIFFICEGMVRAFYYENDEEITSWIAAENDFFYSPSSFIQQKPAYETIQLLENSVFLSISRQELEAIYNFLPDNNNIMLRITEKYLIKNETWVRMLRLPAHQRMELFGQLYPNIFKRIKVQHLASFLGLSRSHVSHLRGRKL